MSIRIILADDHKITREGLTTMLKAQSDMEVIGEAETGRSIIKLAKELEPDIIIMDITMPDLNGIEATRRIRSLSEEIKVIGLSMHSDKRFVKGMFEAGASGYLLKDCAFEELVRAVRAVADGLAYLSPAVTSLVLEDFLKQPAGGYSEISLLTPRETEILQLIVEGRSTKEVAYDLGISVKTVESHRRRIMEKLGIHNIAELTKLAIKEGLTSLDV
ncbi:MAG: response regulator transcription factor [Proteobacteria bacterium]|nr:response regulator transcription factor [Pseudomonadota bacterium]